MSEEMEGQTPNPEESPKNPTEASKSFLRKARRSIGEVLPYILPIAAATVFFGDSMPTDIAQGDYNRAVIKGAIAGLSVVPIAYKIFKGR